MHRVRPVPHAGLSSLAELHAHDLIVAVQGEQAVQSALVLVGEGSRGGFSAFDRALNAAKLWIVFDRSEAQILEGAGSRIPVRLCRLMRRMEQNIGNAQM